MNATVFNDSGTTSSIIFDRNPDICPWCHMGIEPHFISGFQSTVYRELYLTFYCTREKCKRYFIGVYHPLPNSYYFNRTLLGQLVKKVFSDDIATISRDFVRIYNQCRVGEENQLDDIAGPGYRKAFEFLIKDFIISRDEALRDTVSKTLLGQCIAEHIENTTIKSLAKRAVWLGNDETHYIRKWQGKDVSDLKILIELTIHWIETEIATKRAIEAMPESGPSNL